MDTHDTNQPLFSLRINDNLRMHLRSAAVVAGIAAILSLSSSLLKVVAAFMNKNKITEYRYEGFNQTSAAVERTSNIAGAIFTLIISFLLFYFLNRFAARTKAGLNANNIETVNSGLGGLSGYMVTIGILLIICFAFMLLLLVVALSAGAK